MSMEGFPQEPQISDESERIDDVEKAEVMANASHELRSFAAETRAEPKQDQPYQKMGINMQGDRLTNAEMAGEFDRVAEEKEATAEEFYDQKNKLEGAE